MAKLTKAQAKELASADCWNCGGEGWMLDWSYRDGSVCLDEPCDVCVSAGLSALQDTEK